MVRCGARTPVRRRGWVAISRAKQVTSLSVPGLRYPDAIAAGPDGALWVTDPEAHRLARVALDGATRRVETGGVAPGEIAVGADEALWVSDVRGPPILRVDVSGALRVFRLRQALGEATPAGSRHHAVVGARTTAAPPSTKVLTSRPMLQPGERLSPATNGGHSGRCPLYDRSGRSMTWSDGGYAEMMYHTQYPL